jgi:hypothetical protein
MDTSDLEFHTLRKAPASLRKAVIIDCTPANLVQISGICPHPWVFTGEGAA